MPEASPTTPLSSPSLENGLLYLLLLDPAAIDECLEALPESAKGNAEPLMTDPLKQSVFTAILSLHSLGSVITVPLVVDFLARQKIDYGAASMAISHITDSPSCEGAGDLTRSLLDYWQRRAATTIMDRAKARLASGAPVESVLADQERSLIGIKDSGKSGGFRSIQDVANEAMKEIEDVADGKDIPGVLTGITRLDGMTGGFRPTELIILAARPGEGKSAFAATIASHISMREEIIVPFFSGEMKSGEIIKRLLASYSGVPLSAIRGNKNNYSHLDHDRLQKIYAAKARLDASNLYLEDTRGLTVRQIAARIAKIGRGLKIGMIVIDYIQLLRPEGRYQGNRNLEVGEISWSLKCLAGDLACPILALSQLSRPDKGDAKKMPDLPALRDSGSLEQDADMVIFLKRQGAPADYENVTFKIAKQRNGETGERMVGFAPAFTRFYNLPEN